ncbi:MAG: hypothetical protein JXQ72_04015 [Anaerolineae bacterium]|nr:hypothetical protein [Anaerolineae bacterium]
MAKKTRKPNLPQETLERARRELERSGEAPILVQPKAAVPAAGAAVPPAQAVVKPRRQSASSAADLREEYAYVISDLQNMGILAAALGVVLVIMSFFI